MSTQKIETKSHGKIVIVYDSNAKDMQIPLFCKECKFPMKTIDDSISFRAKGCCYKCDLNWSYVVEVDWKDATKHPSVVLNDQWTEYIKNRQIQTRPILIFK